MNMVKEKDHNGDLKLIDIILQERLNLRFIKFISSCHLKKIAS